MDKINEYLQIAIDKVVFFLPKIVLAAVILWIGFKVVKKLVQLLNHALQKSGFSETLRPFIESTATVLLKGAVLFAIASVIGADLTGLFAILAAAGFAIGMALQGSLGNFASGILIMFLKPYEVDDWIQVGDSFGKVEEISIFNTVVVTPGDKTLIIPNAKITDDVVANYSKKGFVRLEIQVSMPYNEDFPKIKRIIKDALAPIDKILKDPEPEVGIESFDSHSIVIAVRPYALPDDFWEVTFTAHQEIKKAFSNNNVKVAYSEGVELGNIGA